jgi:hypothetical protein
MAFLVVGHGIVPECHLDGQWDFAVLGVWEGPTFPSPRPGPLFFPILVS